MSRRKQLAVAALLILNYVLTGGGYFGLSHQAGSAQAAQHREQLAAQRAGAAVEAKLCRTLGKLAALQPPPGTRDANPSRAFEQDLHATLAELGPDIGCGRKGHP